MSRGERRAERDTLRPSSSWSTCPPGAPGDHRLHFSLEILSGPDQGRRVICHSLPISIGSMAECDLWLTDRYVSHRHCSLALAEDGSILLCDETSRNGTFVNGMRVFQVALSPGTEVQVGKTRIRFTFGEDDDAEVRGRVEQFGDLVGTSRTIRTAFDALRRVAPTALTCLLLGETGTGKELAVRAIHSHSSRASGPFVIIDCAAVSETLIEDKLFGHERGAFTGAVKDARGAFEEAGGGTIFLDEVGELPLELQPKLLRVLERREIVRLGSHQTIPVDVRVLAATHRDLASRAVEGTFRQDLYYRLTEASIWLPPLRSRPEDVGLLARHLLDRAGGPPVVLQPDAIAALERHAWPGNVRELRNVLRRAAATTSSGSIDAKLLEHVMGVTQVAFGAEATTATNSFSLLPIAEARDAHRKEYLKTLLEKHGDDHATIAQHMGVHVKYARRLMRKYGLIR